MNNPLVSVVITTYKRSPNILQRAIKSVLTQTYRNIEIIIVNDSPNDYDLLSDTERLVESMISDKFRYIRNDITVGACAARNIGIQNSRGEYIAFLDDDDEWLPEKTEKQIALFTNYVGLVYCSGWIVKNGIKTPYYTDNDFKTKQTFFELLCSDVIGTTSQAIVSRLAIDFCGGFDINQPARQDYEMWIRISKHFECVGIKERLFIHHKHDGIQITKNLVCSAEGYRNIYKKYKKDYNRNWKAKLHMLNTIKSSCYSAGLKYTMCFYSLVKLKHIFLKRIIIFMQKHTELSKLSFYI